MGMRTLPPLLPLLSLIAIGACATLPHSPRSDGLARLGEATRVGSQTVRPLSVVEDSRCPENGAKRATSNWASPMPLA